MALRSRHRGVEAWPGYVDVLSTLLMVIVFVLMIFVIGQLFLSQALSGRDEALARLNQQIAELADILSLREQESTELKSQVDQLSGALTRSTAERDDLRNQLVVVIGERDDLQGQVGQLERQLQSSSDKAAAQAGLAAGAERKLVAGPSAQGAGRYMLYVVAMPALGASELKQRVGSRVLKAPDGGGSLCTC